MKRTIMKDLHAWKNSGRRKPLVLRGARQVGKTWVLEEFGRTFPDGFVRFNFDKNPEFAQFFQTTKDVRRILQNLAMASGQKITKDTLIIFDEMQACEDALNSLKYFKEDAPESYVASAGSLLGLQLSGGFPVGQVDFLEMGPMTFTEFLLADGAENFAEYLAAVLEVFVAHVVPERVVDDLQVVHVAFYNRKFYFVLSLDLAVDKFALGLERCGAPDSRERVLVGDQFGVLQVLS